MKYYLNSIFYLPTLINDFRKQTEEKWNTKQLPSNIEEFWTELEEIVELSTFFGVDLMDQSKKDLEKRLDSILNHIIFSRNVKEFRYSVAIIKAIFDNTILEFQKKIGLLDEDEKTRLNEAFNCYINELNYSTIVMSVSAIESRLFSLMISKAPDSKLEELTLGQLIWEYTHNKEKYGNVIPEKHEPLLNFCNIYRIFSVHPKKEKITRANSTSILCMTCSFLFDENLKTKIEKSKS